MTEPKPAFSKPSARAVATAIGRVTFTEVIRDKILYNILLCSVLLFALGFLASQLTFARPERVILDFGLSAINLSCAMIAIFVGSSLIGREFERRTVFVALSHPITRRQFVLGKYLGILLVVAANWALLSTAYLAILVVTGGGEVISSTLFAALGLVLLQSALVAALAIFFSTFSTTSLAAVMTIGLYLVGNSITEIRAVGEKATSPASKLVFKSIAAVLPNLENFNISRKVTYSLPVSAQFLATSTLYAVVAVALLLVLAGFFIRGKEV